MLQICSVQLSTPYYKFYKTFLKRSITTENFIFNIDQLQTTRNENETLLKNLNLNYNFKKIYRLTDYYLYLIINKKLYTNYLFQKLYYNYYISFSNLK